MTQKKQRIPVTVIEAAIKQPLKPLIIKLLKETQSPKETAEKLTEMSGLNIDANRLNYLRLKLGIKNKAKMIIR